MKFPDFHTPVMKKSIWANISLWLEGRSKSLPWKDLMRKNQQEKFHCVTISHHHVKWPVPQISSENRQTAWLIYQLVHPVLSMDHGEGQVGQILQVANFWFIFFYFAVILT